MRGRCVNSNVVVIAYIPRYDVFVGAAHVNSVVITVISIAGYSIAVARIGYLDSGARVVITYIPDYIVVFRTVSFNTTVTA